MIVLNESGSVGSSHFNEMLEFAKQLVLFLAVDRQDVRVGMLTFDSNVYMQFHLNRLAICLVRLGLLACLCICASFARVSVRADRREFV